MQCPVQNGHPELLLDYCNRKLGSEMAALFDRHSETCEECTRVIRSHRQIWAALDEWEPEPVSNDFDARLTLRISREGGNYFWRRLLGDYLAWRPGLPLAGVSAALAVAAILLIPPGNQQTVRPTGNHETGRIEALEPEQVERTLEDIEMLKQFSAPPNGIGTQALSSQAL